MKNITGKSVIRIRIYYILLVYLNHYLDRMYDVYSDTFLDNSFRYKAISKAIDYATNKISKLFYIDPNSNIKLHKYGYSFVCDSVYDVVHTTDSYIEFIETFQHISYCYNMEVSLGEEDQSNLSFL